MSFAQLKSNNVLKTNNFNSNIKVKNIKIENSTILM